MAPHAPPKAEKRREAVDTFNIALVVVRLGRRILLVHERKFGRSWYLPAGRVDPGETFAAAAMRETLEEVGLDLRALGARRLGQLDDHPSLKQRSWARFTVVPVVYAIEGDPPLTLDAREVAEAMWVPLEEVRRTQGSMLWWFRPLKAIPVKLPMRLPRWQWRGLTIWGLTYGMLRELMERAESAP